MLSVNWILLDVPQHIATHFPLRPRMNDSTVLLSTQSTAIYMPRISLFLVIAFCSTTFSLVLRLAPQRTTHLQRSHVHFTRQHEGTTTSLFSSVESADVIRIDSTSSTWSKISSGLKLIYRFSRPHTIKVCATREHLNPLLCNPYLVIRALRELCWHHVWA